MTRDSMVPVVVNVRREMFRQVALAAAVLLALCGALAGLSRFAGVDLHPRAVARVALIAVAAWSFLRLKWLGTEPALGGSLLTGLGGLGGVVILELLLP
jgi:hypothetical protein